MLFFLNDQIVDVAAPEIHVERRWKTIGCGYPHDLTASDVVDFVHSRLDHARLTWRRLMNAEAHDLAALVISRTGANSFMLKLHEDGTTQPMLQDVPATVLETFARGMASRELVAARAVPQRLENKPRRIA